MVQQNMSNIKFWIPYAIIAIILILRGCDKEVKTIKIPVIIEVEVPVIEKQFDTIYKPVPYKIKGDTKIVIDSIYYDKYIAIKDSVTKDSIFKDAITIREYKEKVEDDTITIDIYMKTRGLLLDYQVGYKTKPRKILLDTTILVKISNRYKTKIGVGGGVLFPTLLIDPSYISFNAGVALDTKKIIYILSYNTDKEVGASVMFKF